LNIILYIAVFIIGTLLGSFFTLAVYRIPLKKDITHERSFCPNCNHRLKFLDLIPVLSYVFLGGKCRYCKQKIRPRYLILEISSGILFLLFYISLKIDIFNLDIYKLIYFIFGVFFMSNLIIMGGIEKEKHYIPNSLIIFGLAISLIYIIYLYVLHFSIYKYVIYFILMLALVIINSIILKKNQKQNYMVQILAILIFLLIVTKEKIVILGMAITLILCVLTKLVKQNKESKQVPIGFYLCITNITILILTNFIANYL